MSDIVALAASPEQIARTTSLRDAARIHKAAQRYAEQASSWALKAFSDKSLSPDAVSKRLTPAVDKAWDMGTILGNSTVRRQAKVHKMGKPRPALPDPKTLKRLQGDVQRIIRDYRRDVAAADSQELKSSVAKSAALRLSMAAEAALKMAAADVLQRSMVDTGTYKRWTTTSAVPCSHCKKLDGMTIPWADEFPKEFSGAPKLGVHQEKFLGPPRHPNCACVLHVVPAPKGK